MASLMDWFQGSSSNGSTLITTLGGIINTAIAKPGQTTIVTPGSSVTTSAGSASVGANGVSAGLSSIGGSFSQLTQSKWFLPVVLILAVALLFGKTIKKLFK